MLKDNINTTLQLSLVLFLFLSAFLVKPEFFNGIVTGKQYGLELAALCIAGYLIFFLSLKKSMRVTRVDTGIIILCLWYLLGEIINGFPFVSFEHAVFSVGLWTIIYLTVYFVPCRVNHYEALKTWRNAERLYSFRSYNGSVIEYEKAFPVLSGNGLFLQIYGKALNMDEQHQRSIVILNVAANLYNSHILQNTLGDSHKALGNFQAAETAYIESSYMMPSMLLPRYLLAKLYHESGENGKARQTAEELLSSPVKVESSATREIMGEMEKIIRENSE